MFCLDTVYRIYAAKRPFSHGEKSQINFSVIEEIIGAESSASMSEWALSVHDIVANLLLTDPVMIAVDSDFFCSEVIPSSLANSHILFAKMS